MGDCTETLKELELFLDGELTPAARDEIRAHLDDCPECFEAFDFYAELKIVIAAKCHNDEMPAGLLARIERCFHADLDGDGRIG